MVTRRVTRMTRLNSEFCLCQIQMQFSETLPLTGAVYGAFISILTVSIILRWIYKNPEVRSVGHVIVIILGALGVFCTITVAPVFLANRAWTFSLMFTIFASLLISILATIWIFDSNDEATHEII